MSSDPFRLRGLTYAALADVLGAAGPDSDRRDAAWMEWFERLRRLALITLRPAGAGGEADDIAATIVARMLEQRHDPQGALAQIRRAQQPEAYVRTIVRNEAYRFLKRESHERHEPLPAEWKSSGDRSVDEAIYRELRQALTDRYSHLMEVGLSSGEITKADFDLLWRWAQGVSTRQLALEFRTTEIAVRKRIERAKQRYRRVFSRDISQVMQRKGFADTLADALQRAADEISDP
jgi:DNA-directed RNA polymerase specialized sigma24 family protein